ncbi:MAG: hypothetical protein IIV91_04500 [Alistipes sp.]|nr:hypothetical protein [Alistipes sp.]
MNILIITPTNREYANMTATIATATSLHHTYTVAQSGIGKAAAAATVASIITKSATSFDMIVVVGFAAGTLGFKQGDIVCPNVARYHDCDVPDGFIPELTDPFSLVGKDDITVFTGDSFVNARSVAAIKERFGVEHAIFDMEITAIKIAADVCGKIPVAVVKMISDVPEDGHTEHSYDEFADSHSDFTPILTQIEML